MSTDRPLITAADLDEYFGRNKKKPKANNGPEIRFDVPPLTQDEIVRSVTGNGGPWRLLSQVAADTEEARRAARFEAKYGMTPIPEPDFESEDL